MSSSQPLTILTAADVDCVLATLDLERAIASQAAVFDAFSTATLTDRNSAQSIQNPHRTTIGTGLSTSLFMPARFAQLGGSTCKIVSVPKSSAGPDEAGGLPAVTVVLDERGMVRGLVNARRLTAMRNACGSALFLRRYPPISSMQRCVFFGSGEQIHAHASVLFTLHPSIRSCTLVVRHKNARAIALADRLKAEYGNVETTLHVSTTTNTTRFTEEGQAKPSLSDVISRAQIIVAATSSQQSLFDSSSVSPGARLILIGSYKAHMREVDDALIRRSKVIVDSKKACLQEAGELISAGLGEADLEELGSARIDAIGADDIVLFKSVGLGVQDVAIANLVLDEAVAMGLGTRIDGFDG